jgi:two-component system, OmpR family, KDP operon response regulator KdpE
MKPSILLIEDDSRLRSALVQPLQLEGHEVVVATRIKEALAQVRLSPNRFQVVLLDLNLPDGNGESLLDELLRANLSVVVISAEHNEDTRIRLLDRGAEDYLVKPFSVPELMVRIRVATRRRQPSAHGPLVLEAGELVIDTGSHTVTRRGERVRLTPTEFKLLEVLARSADKVVPRRQLLTAVWGPGNTEQTHYLRLYISQLRAKLEDHPADPLYLINEPGVGYKLCSSPTPSPPDDQDLA